jgi:hypothetical protein
MGDLVGSIMAFGAPGRWLYVTNAELRYDPTRKLLGYARLEGVLNDGTVVHIDKTGQPPDSFHLVNDWSEVGPVIVRDIDGQMREKRAFQYDVADDGRVVEKTNEEAAGGGCGKAFPLRVGKRSIDK